MYYHNHDKRVDSHAGLPERSRIKCAETREKKRKTRHHVSSSSSFSAHSSKPPYRPWGTCFQSPLGRGRKLSLRARFALTAIVCGFLDVDVPSPDPTLRTRYEPAQGAS